MPSKKQKNRPQQLSSSSSPTKTKAKSELTQKRKPANFLLIMLVLIPLFVVLSLFVWSPSSLSVSAAASIVLKDEPSPIGVRPILVQKQKIVIPVPPKVVVEILGDYPHDTQAFTQGLEIHGSNLYESTGLQGRSTLRHVDLATGQIIKKFDFEPQIFAEGITIFQDKIYVLTWLNKIGYVFDLNFQQLATWSYNTQGWGLTHSKKHLIMSDGSNKLRWISPIDFKVVRTLEVLTPQREKVNNLNELEWINGHIYANIWYQREIAVINPKTGIVVQWLDCQSLPEPNDGDRVLNGIAYNNETGDLYLTGKLWPKIYKVLYQTVPVP